MDHMQAPASAIVARQASAEDTEEYLEAIEEAESADRIRARSRLGVNKVSEFLGERFYRFDKTWPFLYWRQAGMQLRVEMYFPRLNLAVDRFRRPASIDRQEAAFKAAKLKEHGIKYVALFPETQLKTLGEFIK